MMLANRNIALPRRQPVEHRTEPRIVLQMEGNATGNAKLKPTVFLPSALLRPIRMERAS
jgi:hypothetical protein